MYVRPLSIFLLGLVLTAPGLTAAFAQADPFAQADARACQEEFLKLKGDVEKRALAIKNANDRKAPPKEACGFFRNYVDADSKLLKFLVQKKVSCQVPDPFIQQIQQDLARATTVRTQVCKIASGEGAPPPPPPSMGLSGALGTLNPAGGPPAGTPGGSGVFDTMTGNVMQR